MKKSFMPFTFIIGKYKISADKTYNTQGCISRGHSQNAKVFP